MVFFLRFKIFRVLVEPARGTARGHRDRGRDGDRYGDRRGGGGRYDR
jgi:hypothetical protein